jgi:hypothetical protein
VLPLLNRLLALPANIRQAGKACQGRNGLAYSASVVGGEEEGRVARLAPVANVEQEEENGEKIHRDAIDPFVATQESVVPGLGGHRLPAGQAGRRREELQLGPARFRLVVAVAVLADGDVLGRLRVTPFVGVTQPRDVAANDRRARGGFR